MHAWVYSTVSFPSPPHPVQLAGRTCEPLEGGQEAC